MLDSERSITVSSNNWLGVSVNQQMDCLFNRLFRLTKPKTSKQGIIKKHVERWTSVYCWFERYHPLFTLAYVLITNSECWKDSAFHRRNGRYSLQLMNWDGKKYKNEWYAQPVSQPLSCAVSRKLGYDTWYISTMEYASQGNIMRGQIWSTCRSGWNAALIFTAS